MCPRCCIFTFSSMLLTHETRYVVVCRRLVMRGFRAFSMPFRQMTVSWFLTVLLFATVFFIGNFYCPGHRASRPFDRRYHRRRIDKWLDTLLANQPISDSEASDHCQKSAPQDGGLLELILVQSCLTSHSEAALL